jgi:putative transposase
MPSVVKTQPWDVHRLPRAEGKSFLVTGGNAGIGYFVTEQLAGTGAAVVLGSRDAAKAEAAIASISSRVPGAKVRHLRLDLVDRNFVATAPNRCWVADFTHIATWAGAVYVAFVVDTFSRRVVGWSAPTTKETQPALDSLEMGIWQRDRDGRPHTPGELIHHSDAGSQYTSFKPAEHLDREHIAASIGSVGDAYDNTLMESTIGLCKTELIKPQRPWRTLADVELATAKWIDWYNFRRLHGEIGHVPPAEYETHHYLTATRLQVTPTT